MLIKKRLEKGIVEELPDEEEETEEEIDYTVVM